MSTYLSNLLTHTTSRYNSLRRTLLSSEDDGDTEDDSHITRVLRAYYTEKSRPFPSWLPPDPKDRRAQAHLGQQPSYMQQGQGGYYNNRQVTNVQGSMTNSNRSSLSDLWDSPSTQQAAPQQPVSLRGARRPGVPQGAAAQPSQQGATLGPRPMPSQRAGSYQSVSSQHSSRSTAGEGTSNSGVASGPGTAQERLKARLWGGGARSGTTPPPQGQGGQFAPPTSNPYDNGGSRGYSR